MQAPSTVSESDAGFNVAYSIINSSETTQTINSVTTKLIEDHTQAMSNNSENGMADGASQQKEIASAQDVNPFVLQPGETKQMSMTVPLNISKLVDEILPDNAFAQAAANVLGGIQRVTDVMDRSNFRHFVQVSADVDCITFDPSAHQDIQVLKPGQIGGNLHVQI